MYIKKYLLKPLYTFLQTILGVKRSVAQIHAYRGFGSSKKVIVLGRVTQYAPQVLNVKRQRAFAYALSMIRSYVSDPLEGVTVTARYHSLSASAITNNAGMFEICLEDIAVPEERISEWLKFEVSLGERSGESQTAEVLFEGQDNTYGVISDIDDTVLVSNATQKLKLIYATLFKIPEKRQAFPGVKDLYHAFVAGSSGKNTNPIFYVSSSHWNLFSFLTSFFSHQNIPKGPLLLKNTTGVTSVISSIGSHNHKTKHIEKIFQAYPDLSFILLGDSGQRDAKIYADIAHKYPDRVLMIYIRDISSAANPLFDESAQALASPDEMLLAQTSSEIARHAYNRGYVTTTAVIEVEAAAV